MQVTWPAWAFFCAGRLPRLKSACVVSVGYRTRLPPRGSEEISTRSAEAEIRACGPARMTSSPAPALVMRRGAFYRPVAWMTNL